jgi:F0F1-type ATP synthase membrane subunit b/b'
VGGGCYRPDWLPGQSWQTTARDAKIGDLNLLLSRGAIVSGRDSSRWKARFAHLVALALVVGALTGLAAGCGSSDNNASSEVQKGLETAKEELKKGFKEAEKATKKGLEEGKSAAKQGVEKGQGAAQKAIENAKKEAQKGIEKGKEEASKAIEEAEKRAKENGY